MEFMPDGLSALVEGDTEVQTSSEMDVDNKADPSYKSKRYRDKLRGEIRKLDNLLPVDRHLIHRKLDSQTVFRLAIAYFRTKITLKAAGLSCEDALTSHPVSQSSPWRERPISQLIDGQQLLQAFDGFLLIVASDGTVLFVSQNIAQSLGFSQVELLERCLYGVVHPDDHRELATVLGQGPDQWRGLLQNQVHKSRAECNKRSCCGQPSSSRPPCKSVSFLIRMKCFNGATTGYLKMHCTGHMRALPVTFPDKTADRERCGHVLFALCRPFVLISSEPNTPCRNSGFWSKHGLDLKFKQMDKNIADILGHQIDSLEGTSFYQLVHPEDLSIFAACHRTLIESEEVQTIYFRVQCLDGRWLWLHTRGKVVFKNGKKYSLVFTHCPVREEDSTYIQEEMVLRHQNCVRDLTISAGSSRYLPDYSPRPGHQHFGSDSTETHAALPVKRCRFEYHNHQLDPAAHAHSLVSPLAHGQTLPGPEMTACLFPARRQYLMQVNGVGVSPQNQPTALIFQGQFTAFEAPLHGLQPGTFHPQSEYCQSPYANMLPSYFANYCDATHSGTLSLNGTQKYIDNACCKMESTNNKLPNTPVSDNNLDMFSERPSCLYQSAVLRPEGLLSNVEANFMSIESNADPLNEGSDIKPKAELPAIGSFLDCLNNMCA